MLRYCEAKCGSMMAVASELCQPSGMLKAAAATSPPPAPHHVPVPPGAAQREYIRTSETDTKESVSRHQGLHHRAAYFNGTPPGYTPCTICNLCITWYPLDLYQPLVPHLHHFGTHCTSTNLWYPICISAKLRSSDTNKPLCELSPFMCVQVYQ